jgi:4-amino-4-deoxy-L-arabinose transferase-like glycosyltransferase
MRFGLLPAGLILAVVFAAEVRWIFDHPFGIHSDEAGYLNQVASDAQVLRSGDPRAVARQILYSDRGRPPAYRLVPTPAVALFGPSSALCRLLSLSLFGIAVILVHRTASLLGGPAAAAFAAVWVCLSPDVVAATVFLSTEPPLYLATAAMLWLLVRTWTTGSEPTIGWIGLGLALGLGFLAKASFLMIAAPVMALALFARPLGVARGPSPRWLLQAGALGFAVAAPWWVFNLRFAADFGSGARQFVRHSLGPALAPETLLRWIAAFAQGALGLPVALLLVLVVSAFVWRTRVAREKVLTPAQRIGLLACGCAGLPLILAQQSGTNHLLRHVSPAQIPLAIVAGVLADASGWIRGRLTAAITTALFAVQAMMIAFPVVHPSTRFEGTGLVTGALPWRALVRFDQWDWDPLREVGRRSGSERPSVAYLGNGRTFNAPSIAHPWIARGEEVARVKWLWRYEAGPIVWSEILDTAARADLVVTAPLYVGDPLDKQDLDNAHNAEFAERLGNDARFSGPVTLTMGRFEPVEVKVFVRVHDTD